MEQQEVNLPTTPKGWAVHLSKLLNLVAKAHSSERFPVDVSSIAVEYSQQVFPADPIALIDSRDFDRKFEGGLFKLPNGDGWAIFYNSSIKSRGRKNFTLAHELGHYLLHRAKTGDNMLCSRADMWKWDSEYGLMEAEANEFASYLLMPLDDFRAQTGSFKRPSITDFDAIKDRYAVSLTAAILKWLEIASARAMIVVSRDGFVDWAWSSKPLIRSGVILKPKQKVIEVPEHSVAASLSESGLDYACEDVPAGVWSQTEAVQESALVSEYHDQTISLIIYPKKREWRGQGYGDNEEADLVESWTAKFK
jgi:Zn-dependent peptidase ImmA (M78 family)